MTDIWRNWSGSETAEPNRFRIIRSIDDARAAVRHAAAEGLTVRVAGAGHSHYRLVPTDGVILDLAGLSGVSSVREENGEHIATIAAGTKIVTLGQSLLPHGVGLINQGDIDRQAIGGAVATGTHGTGRHLQNFSAAVRGAEVIGADGELVRIGPDTDPETFEACRLNLGALGLMISVDLAVRPAYRLRDTVSIETWEELRPRIEAAIDSHRHFEFFYSQWPDKAMVKTIDETDEPGTYPIGEEGARQGWSFEVLPSHRPQLHTEMEYSVPLETSLACLDEIRDLLRSRFTDLRMPIEYRTLARDDVWLSTAYQRDVATISVHQTIDRPERELYEACEAVFRHYDGRPHWGKVHYLSGDELNAIHPRWADWWAVRDRFDPDGVFLNERLASWRP